MMDMSGATQDALAKLDTQIAALRAMHARLQAAPSAEARRALRAEQMQLVQQSLALADATPVPAMPMMPGGMMNGRAERGMGPAQRSAGEASGSTSQPMAGGTMHEPMRGGMPAGGGMAG